MKISRKDSYLQGDKPEVEVSSQRTLFASFLWHLCFGVNLLESLIPAVRLRTCSKSFQDKKTDKKNRIFIDGHGFLSSKK